MSNLIYYKDNILSKIKENEDLDKLTEWIRDLCFDETELKLSVGFLSPKFKISKYEFLTLVEVRKRYNEEMIDKYLQLSFKDKEVETIAKE